MRIIRTCDELGKEMKARGWGYVIQDDEGIVRQAKPKNTFMNYEDKQAIEFMTTISELVEDKLPDLRQNE